MLILIYPIISFLFASLLATLLGLLTVIHIENTNLKKATELFGQDNHQWVVIKTNGLLFEILGFAPNQTSQQSAIKILEKEFGRGQVIDQSVIAKELFNNLGSSIRLQKTGSSIVVIGTIIGDNSRQYLMDSLNQSATNLVAEIAVQESPGNFSSKQSLAIDYAVQALSLPQVNLVNVENNRITVNGLAQNENDKQQIISQLEATKSSLDVEYKISSPPLPIISPFTYELMISLARSELISCYAETIEDRNRILTASSHNNNSSLQNCNLAIGAPDENWAQSIEIITNSVRKAGGGLVSIQDKEVNVATIDKFGLEILEKNGFPTLPEGYIVSLSTLDGNDNSKENIDYVLKISKDANRLIEFRGAFPNQRSQRIAVLTSSVKFNAKQIVDKTIINPRIDHPSNNSIQTAVEALNYLHSGVVYLEKNHLLIKGTTENATVKDQISDILLATFDKNNFTLNIRFDSTINAPPPPMDPRWCITQLNKTQQQAKITFEPGSSRINADALGTIAQISDILSDCQHVAIEISGHTDSQGRETMNQQLSEKRARAVLDAILDTGFSPTNLTSVGYGETKPIGDNSTKAGQEKNRRIEFNLFENQYFAPQ